MVFFVEAANTAVELGLKLFKLNLSSWDVLRSNLIRFKITKTNKISRNHQESCACCQDFTEK